VPGGLRGFASAITSFVGRADDVQKVAALLAEYRLVTVTGPGGVGKTRLASEVARQLAGRFADGACLATLTAVQDPALVPTAVAAALGVRQVGGVPVAQSMADVLARQQLLLMLDNCEHVLPAVAELCSALLSAADDLTVLATSREPVGIAGEARYRLRPLAVSVTGQEAQSSPAVSLFADRARRVDPDFSLDGESRQLVARIAGRLDGMPLAIELAAARVEALGLGPLLSRLDNRFALLTTGDRTAADRQRSLAATVDWSYQLLSEQDRGVFRRLAVFPGPFTLDAATAAAGAGAEPTVLHLVDCSLLSPPQASADGESRYGMLETLRAFGADRLTDGGELRDAEAALSRYVLRVAEQAATGMRTSPGELAAARQLDAEDASLHKALAWGLEQDPPTALRLALAMAPWWQLRARSAAGYALLERAIAGGSQQHGAWAQARCWLGMLAIDMADYPAADGHFTAVCDAPGPVPAQERALATACRARVWLNLGRFSDAADEARRALSLAIDDSYPTAEAIALLALSWVASYSGDVREHLTWSQRARQVDPASIPGHVARMCQFAHASAQIQSGGTDEGVRLCREGLDAAGVAGDPIGQANYLYLMTLNARYGGRTGDAWATLHESITLSTGAGSRLRLIDSVDECAFLCATASRWADAVTLWSAYAARLREIGVADGQQDAPARQDFLRSAAQALEPDRMSEAEDRGAAMGLDTAVDFALLLTGTDRQATLTPSNLGGLSARERELVTLVAQGRTDAQIAGQLYISVSTVRSHLDRIRDKTSCRRRAELTRLALQESLV
jgi:predicted ATPase/DNA-binding CsgD family transcriptional regulator